MNGGRIHQWAVTAAAFAAVVLLVAPSTLFIVGQNRRNDQIDEITATQQVEIDAGARRDRIQDMQAQQLERLVTELAEVTAQREADRLAFELTACLYGNHAKRIARADAEVAISVLIAGLRMSPHDGLADQLETDIRARMSTAATSDHDCDGSGIVGDPGDYPPD